MSLFWKLVPVLLSAALIGWVLWRWLKSSDEPLLLIVRWIVTALVLGFVFRMAAQAKDEFSKIAAILVAAVGGLIMVVVWRQKLCDWVADKITSLYTGGRQEADPAPFYSIAQAKRKRGEPQQALEEVRGQLARFPQDFTGWMLLAEIQAEDLKDLPAAQATIRELLTHEGRPAKNIAFALNREADWHLKLARDRDAARAALEHIVALLPGTEQAQLALQRIAHLTPAEMLAARQEPQRVRLQAGEQNIGLRREALDLAPPEEDPDAQGTRLIQHLEQSPFDDEAREQLALLYARHYQRLDLAAAQLEQLISSPNQPGKQVVRWLNLLADLQVEAGGDLDAARQTLRRIVDLNPKSAAAGQALNRIAHLKLELRPREQSQAIKLGSYEQNIGLQGGLPRKPDH